MSFTVTYDKTTFGNKKVHILDVTADAAENNIETGLHHVTGFSLGFRSMTTSAFTIHENALSTGTAAAGYLAASGLTSGDEFYIIAYGT